MYKRQVQLPEWYALKIFGGFLVFGLLIRLIDMNGHVTRWVESGSNDNELRGDFMIPSKVIGGLVLVALIAISVVGSYAYYPPPEVVLKEMYISKGEALSAALTGKPKEATYWIDICDDWSRKLEVGTFLRYGEVSEYHHWKARLYREQLELMEHAIEDADPEHTRMWVSKLQRSHTRMAMAFREL